jgi:uncharacterized protein (TIGR00369 family)
MSDNSPLDPPSKPEPLFKPENYDIPSHFQHFPGDSAEDFLGPFFYYRDGKTLHTAFRLQPHHCNSSGITHGGLLMSFADYSLCLAALSNKIENVVTVNLNSDFLGPSNAGDLVLGQTEVSRQGKNLAFTRCQLMVNDKPIFNASAVVRLFRKQQKE